MYNESVKFSLGQLVYYRTNDARVGIVTGIVYRSSGVFYWVTWDDQVERTHFDVELSEEKVYSEPKNKEEK